MVLVLTIIIPIIFAILIALLGEKDKPVRYALVMIPSVINFSIIAYIGKAVLAGNTYEFIFINLDPFVIKFHIDAFGLLMGMVVSSLWILTNLYAFGYMAHEHSQTRFYTVLTLVSGATLGIIFAANLVTLFIFFEWLTYSVYLLVIHEETEDAYRGGIVYGVYCLSGGICLLLAIILTFTLTGGNTAFTAGGIPELANQSTGVLYLLFILFILGFGVKSALMPLHAWLPQAMVAPTPVSALLHAVAVVNVGLYGIIRMIYNVFGPQLFGQLHLNIVLAVAASITIIIAALIALRQTLLKRMLAYSTINQLSYVVLGAASLHPLAFLGALIHICYHSIMKITLFYSAGAIIHTTGKTKVRQLAGLAIRMPITAAAFVTAALGIIGVPPIAGWISKWYLIDGFLELKQAGFAWVLILSSIIELGFFVPPILYAYFAKGEYPEYIRYFPCGKKPETSPNMLVPLVIVAVLSVTFGLIGSAPYIISSAVVQQMLP